MNKLIQIWKGLKTATAINNIEVPKSLSRYFIDESKLTLKSAYEIRQNSIGSCIDIYEDIPIEELHTHPACIAKAWFIGESLAKTRRGICE